MDGGNTFRQARFLGTAVLGNGLSPTIQVADTLEAGETVEWYRFRIRGRASSAPLKPIIGFGGGEFATRMELFQAAKNKPGKLLARLDNINGQKQRSLPNGTFFIKVSGTPAPAGSGQFATFVAQINLFG
ncbi:MAG: hypothetical protein ACKO7W_03980 [Elainella sp.]